MLTVSTIYFIMFPVMKNTFKTILGSLTITPSFYVSYTQNCSCHKTSSLRELWIIILANFCLKQTDRPSDRQTNQQTDQPTGRPTRLAKR